MWKTWFSEHKPTAETPQKPPDWQQSLLDLTARIEKLERLVAKLTEMRIKGAQSASADATNAGPGTSTVEIGGRKYNLPPPAPKPKV